MSQHRDCAVKVRLRWCQWRPKLPDSNLSGFQVSHQRWDCLRHDGVTCFVPFLAIAEPYSITKCRLRKVHCGSS
jgi:hypothetical protein